MKPGARPPLDSQYFKRMAAIEFAVKFDDGVGAGLDDADIVLVGVSRTSKTPLSMYLGYLGYKTANVPIVKGIEPAVGALRHRPDEDRRPHHRRGAAARDPQAARSAPGRRERAYAELLEIYAELEEAEVLQRRLGCPVIDISDLSIEETAARVIRLVEQRRAENGTRAQQTRVK